jgi:hypothetical protein
MICESFLSDNKKEITIPGFLLILIRFTTVGELKMGLFELKRGTL